ncbi:hypothetical protein Q427_09570 [Halomonas sp. BC04]|nr:hypothetical protein Q427_09570 [Halomonas sp. BC04]
MNGTADQRMHQFAVAEQAVPAGRGEAQGLGHQVITVIEQVAYQDWVIGRCQAGIVHGAGKAGGLALQGRVVHAGEPLAVDLDARILATRLGRAKQRADQAVGALAADTQVDRWIGLADGDLGDHLLDRIDLDRALLEDAPDLLDQLVDDVLIADAVGQVTEQVARYLGKAPLGLALGFTRGAEQQPQVERQHLGQVVMGLFGGYQRMQVVALGHRHQAQLTQ